MPHILYYCKTLATNKAVLKSYELELMHFVTRLPIRSRIFFELELLVFLSLVSYIVPPKVSIFAFNLWSCSFTRGDPEVSGLRT